MLWGYFCRSPALGFLSRRIISVTLHGDPYLVSDDHVPPAVEDEWLHLIIQHIRYTVIKALLSYVLPSDSEKSHHGVGNHLLQEEN